MKTWLVVAGKEQINSSLLSHLTALSEDISILLCHDAEGAMLILQDHEIDLMLTSAHDSTIDCLELIPGALAFQHHLKVSVSSRLSSSMESLHDLTPCLRFISEPPVESELKSLLNGNSAVCPFGHTKGLDAFLVVTLLAHSGSNGAYGLSFAQGRGTLGFVNGILTHAEAGHLAGNDALQQMCLWEQCLCQPCDPNESVERDANITEPVAELLKNAAALKREFSGIYEMPPVIDEDQLNPAGRERALLAWWKRRAAESPGVVRVLFGFTPNSGCTCVDTIPQEFADVLNVRSQWSSSPDDGPSFVRIHTEKRGLLSLTFVPMIDKNRFIFETFAGQSEAVVVCDAYGRSSPNDWRELVPDAKTCVLAEHGAACQKTGCAALAQLVGDPE